MRIRIIALVTALVMALSTLMVVNPAPASAKPMAQAVTCYETQATARTRVEQQTLDIKKRQFMVDVIQAYNVCLNRLGPDYIKPTWYRYRYVTKAGLKCTNSNATGTGLRVVKFRTHFYDRGNAHGPGPFVKSMRQIAVPCEKDGTASIYGRWGKRTSPSLNWINSSAGGSPSMAVTVGVDWRSILTGAPDGTGSMFQRLYARRS